jgi:hypothetical protein
MLRKNKTARSATDCRRMVDISLAGVLIGSEFFSEEDLLRKGPMLAVLTVLGERPGI